MIPAHSADGFLPEGVHSATWAEFVHRFGFSARRALLLQRLHAMLTHLAAAGCTRVLISGSFITPKTAPADVDLVWLTRGVDESRLHPALLDMTAGHVAIKRSFELDMFPHDLIEASTDLPFAMFFMLRKDDDGLRGVVEIKLETLEAS
jgi:hypothetical protein